MPGSPARFEPSSEMRLPLPHPFATCNRKSVVSRARVERSFVRRTRPAFPRTPATSNQRARQPLRSVLQDQHHLEGAFPAEQSKRHRRVVAEENESLRSHSSIHPESSLRFQFSAPKRTPGVDAVCRIVKPGPSPHQTWRPVKRKSKASRNHQSAHTPPGSSAPAPTQDCTAETSRRNRSIVSAMLEEMQLACEQFSAEFLSAS